MFTLITRRHDVSAMTTVSMPNTVLEIKLICHQTLKVNNFVSKQYLLTKFCGSFKDAFRIKCV